MSLRWILDAGPNPTPQMRGWGGSSIKQPVTSIAAPRVEVGFAPLFGLRRSFARNTPFHRVH